MDAFAIGVDLGGTNLRVAAVDNKGEILESMDSPSGIRQGRESVVVRLTDAVRLLSRKYSSSHSFKGVGVGLPGIIDIQSATYDDPDAVPARAHVQVAERIKWMERAHELPMFERYPPRG